MPQCYVLLHAVQLFHVTQEPPLWVPQGYVFAAYHTAASCCTVAASMDTGFIYCHTYAVEQLLLVITHIVEQLLFVITALLLVVKLSYGGMIY